MADEETKDKDTNEEEPKWLQTLMNKIDSLKPNQTEQTDEETDPVTKVKIPLIPDPIPDEPDEEEEQDEEPTPPKKSFLSWLM